MYINEIKNTTQIARRQRAAGGPLMLPLVGLRRHALAGHWHFVRRPTGGPPAT